MSLIELKEVSKIYNKGKENECIALDNVSVQIEEGEFVGVIGKSGSGKSTFLHIAGLIDRYSSGSVIFDGINMDKIKMSKLSEYRKKYIGFILQDFGLMWNMSVFDNIATPLCIDKEKKRVIKERVEAVAKELGITELLSKKAKNLSGGQSQRVAIARALIKNPKVIFADEPTGALDKENGEQIMELLSEINKKGTTVIMVTHDLELANKCERLIRLEDGKKII